jgi:exonuclease III
MYNLITLNINGLNDPTKRTALIDWLKCMKADIVCLQEMHASSHSSIQSWFRNSGFYVASSSVSNKRCGTAILVRDVFSITQVKRDDEGRFLQVEVDIDGQELRFVSLYAPNRNPARNTFLFLILWTLPILLLSVGTLMQSLTLIWILSVDRHTRVPRKGPLRAKALRLFTLC